jgi:hypothetical protein
VIQSTEGKNIIMKTIKDMLDYIEGECKKIDREERFDQMLDEYYSFDCVGGPFDNMTPSDVLKTMDPIAHRCGVADYADNEDWHEINGDYYERREVSKAQEEFLDDLESDLIDLQNELDELNEDDESEPDCKVGTFEEIAAKEEQIKELEEFIKECCDYSF